jgi:hypothetical protein
MSKGDLLTFLTPATAGQKIFQEALADGTMAGFFKLMQEFR